MVSLLLLVVACTFSHQFLSTRTHILPREPKLSLSEIQLVLTQHTQDELLLRRLAKAVAQHVAKQDKTDHSSNKIHDLARQSPGPVDCGVGNGVRQHGSSSGSGGGGDSVPRDINRNSNNSSGMSRERENGNSRSVRASGTKAGCARRWRHGGSNDDGESSDTIMPVGANCGGRNNFASPLWAPM